jgi:subtilisin family serine protease
MRKMAIAISLTLYWSTTALALDTDDQLTPISSLKTDSIIYDSDRPLYRAQHISTQAIASKPSLPQANLQTLKVDQNSPQQHILTQHINPEKNAKRRISQFAYEPDLAPGKYTYIVELHAPSVIDKPELKRSLTRTDRQLRKHSEAQNINAHLDYLDRYQGEFLHTAVSNTGAKAFMQYKYALNAVALTMTQADAVKLTRNAKVKKITRETIYKTATDQGPNLIGAPRLWRGEVGSLQQSQGEGIVIGIIDSGINTDHPSFAEVSGDGYVHSNPLGDGVYLGDCADMFAQLCNNKLIGVYSYQSITDSYSDTDVFPPNLPRNGEDYGGHGSHVAATAAGNVLNNLAETLPTQDQQESDGTPTGFTFEQISGVAPRANIISYQACYGGRSDQDDTYADCPGSAIIASIEDAIQDGVDVINFSISGGGDPWQDATERAFLTAQSVGIFVATSAGNSGPGVSSSEKHAPWYTSVAASEHGRQNAFVKTLTNLIGGVSPPPTIKGQSNTGSINASIVYAGDFTNLNDPTNDSAQCLQPFPINTFSGQIVVCERGEIARIEKAENVAAGGAGGFVLVNVQGEESFLANDVYVVPGIHISADDGDRLKQWLAIGANHQASITAGVASQSIDAARVDVLANFSSRGPNTSISILTPTLTAPGVDIYSAYADQRFGHDGHSAPAGDFNYLSGTSMSSPHVAGAGALLKALKPNWTPDNIRSALAMTATLAVLREDGATEADYFDMGSGRIRVDLAAQTGLVMNQTQAGYVAAEPAKGGDPRSLNLPSITDNECVATCTWSRTFKATKDGVWDVITETFDEGLAIRVNPEQFSIQAGQTQTLEVTIDGVDADKNKYIFGQVTLTSDNSPVLHMPVSIVSSIGDIPTEVAHQATRDRDSILLKDIDAVTLNDFVLTPYALVKATKFIDRISEDSDSSDYLDNVTDGVAIIEVDVAADSKRLVAEIVSSSAPDLDLYLAYDRNNDGRLSSFEEIAQSLSSDATEKISLNNPQIGKYFIVVQNFTGSSNQADSFELRYAVVGNQQDDSLRVDAPSSLSAFTPFDMRFFYQLENAELGDDYYGAIEMGTGAENRSNLGLIALDIARIEDDVVLNAAPARVISGDVINIGVAIAGNDTNEDRTYNIEIPLPQGTEFLNVGDGTVVNGLVRYLVTKFENDRTVSKLNFQLRINQDIGPGPIEIALTSELQNRSQETPQRAPLFTDIQVEGPPTIDFNGEPSTTLNVFETRTLIIPLNVADPNGDSVNLSFTQTEGPTVEIMQTDGLPRLIAPSVDTDLTLRYSVQASDGNGNIATAIFAVNVRNNAAPVNAAGNGGGGSVPVGWLILLSVAAVFKTVYRRA